MKIRYFIFGLMFVAGLAAAPLVSAAPLVRTCPNDYYSFIRHVRSEYTRHEFAADFFKRSYCQVSDILVLNDELEEIRDKFRTAAYACEDTAKYKSLYHQILMETFFIRHVQEISSDLLEDEEMKDAVKRKAATLEKLKEDMYQIFVIDEKRVDSKTFNDYFEGWANKYDDKIADYAKCEDGPWAEVNEVLQDFNETWKSLSINVENEKREGKIVQFAKTETEVTTKGWSKVKSTLKSFGDKFKKQKEEEVEDPLTVDKAAKQSRILSDAFSTLQKSENVYDIEYDSAMRMAEYQLIYGEGGARPARDLQTLIADINATLEETNVTDFPNILSGVNVVLDRQCK
ncbi:hypothetical protein KKC94_02140 [Patescibacteria group bacterium]|nr:hypothetical protein [Patescibacteria group bacterium]